MRRSASGFWLALALAMIAGAAQAACLCAPARFAGQDVHPIHSDHASHAAPAAHVGHAAEAPAEPCHASAADCPDAHGAWAAPEAPELPALIAAPAAILARAAERIAAPRPAPETALLAPRPPPLKSTPVGRRTLLLI